MVRPKFEHIWGSLCDEGALDHVGSGHMGSPRGLTD